MGGVDCANQLCSFYFASYSSRKWYRYIFWFLFNLSVCNEFILESTYHADQGKQKRPMISFRLDLAKQLIDGFSQRKRKRRSPENPHHPVAREEHVSVHVDGRKRKCVQCIKVGRRTPKGYKIETRFECSFARSRSAEHVTMNTTHKDCESFTPFQ